MRDTQTNTCKPHFTPSVHHLWFCSQLSPCCILSEPRWETAPTPPCPPPLAQLSLSPPSSAPLWAPVMPTKSPCCRGLITCGLNKQTHAPPALRLQEMSTLQVLTLGQTCKTFIGSQ